MATMTPSRRSTVIRGTAIGALAYLIGYLFTWILAGTKTSKLFVTGPFGSAVADWKALLWVFYDSHFVGTQTPTVTGLDGATFGGDLVDTVSVLGVEYLYVVPPLVLVIAGVAIAWTRETETPSEGLVAGLSIVIGYVVIVVLGMLIGQQSGVGPSPLRALMIAGVVYPIGFGGIGGAIAGFVGGR